jgi:hypothetical protein
MKPEQVAKNPFSKDEQTALTKKMYHIITDCVVDEVIEKAGSWENVNEVDLHSGIVNGFRDILGRMTGKKLRQSIQELNMGKE